jgi:hypothetical protein
MSRKETLSRTFAITLKEVKLAKVGSRRRPQPCTKELEMYISAMSSDGDDASSMAKQYGKMLAICMEGYNPAANKNSMSFHLSNFVKR